jgi:hypothetical protein
MHHILAIITFLMLESSANAKAFSKHMKHDDREGHAIVLVHGWGRMPRKPHSIWKNKIQPYTDLSTLKKRYEYLGFKQVFSIEYDDLQSVDQMARSVAEQIHKILDNSAHGDLKLDVVGHSMGQFVAAKAILEERYLKGRKIRLADRVRVFIGLAGIVRGQDELYPCTIFPGQCGGGGDLEPFYTNPGQGSREVQKIFAENYAVIDRLKKCSVYSEADEIVKTPYNAASFRGLGFNPQNLVDVEINSRREKFHNDVKESASIFSKIISNCYSLVGGVR